MSRYTDILIGISCCRISAQSYLKMRDCIDPAYINGIVVRTTFSFADLEHNSTVTQKSILAFVV